MYMVLPHVTLSWSSEIVNIVIYVHKDSCGVQG